MQHTLPFLVVRSELNLGKSRAGPDASLPYEKQMKEKGAAKQGIPQTVGAVRSHVTQSMKA